MRVSAQNELKPENYQINAKICRLVEKFPCMYDRSHSHYLKKDIVDKAWVKISKEMDDSIPSCKERWRNIRTSFARSINVNKIPASANRTKPYYLHEELQFLARHITPGIPIPRRSNAYSSAGEESEVIEVSVGEDTFDGFALARDEDSQTDQPSSNEEDEQTEEPHKPEKDERKIKKDAIAVATAVEEEEKTNTIATTTTTTATTEVEKTPTTTELPNSPIMKRRRTEEDMPMREIFEQKYSPPIVESDFDALFLQGLLPEMKAMDFRQKILFKRRIYEVIGEVFEGTTINTKSSTSTSSNALSAQNATVNNNFTYAKVSPQNNIAVPAAVAAAPMSIQSNNNINTNYQPTVAPTMTVVNAADLAMIRRLNSLLQSPQGVGGAASSPLLTTTMAAAPKNAATLRSGVGGPATATVAVNRGALTRSSANLMRVTMVNAPLMAPAPQPIKQEPEIIDDD